MSKEHATVNQLIQQLQKTVDDYRIGYDMCCAAAVGCLRIVECTLIAEAARKKTEKVEPVEVQKCRSCLNTAEVSSFVEPDLCSECWGKENKDSTQIRCSTCGGLGKTKGSGYIVNGVEQSPPQQGQI